VVGQRRRNLLGYFWSAVELDSLSHFACLLGFWGKCYNDYKATNCHRGYEIVLEWSKKWFGDKRFAFDWAGSDHTAQFHSSFVFTSNVDSHFIKSGWPYHLVQEIHGSAMNFQCANRCEQRIWQLPDQFQFIVDTTTMRAPNKVVIQQGPNSDREHHNHARCKYCGKAGRPNVREGLLSGRN